MNVAVLTELLAPVATVLRGRPLNRALQIELNRCFPARGLHVQVLHREVVEVLAAGWVCRHEQDGIRYGRVIMPCPQLANCSVDVVELTNAVGPRHLHPQGEICLTLPLTGLVRLDGHPAGWLVYPPGSTHWPTLSGGRAYVLNLLPSGAIEFI